MSDQADDLRPQWLTLTQLAAELSIPVQTLYKWRMTGRVPRAHKVGGALLRFKREDVDAWLAAHAEPQVTDLAA